MSDLSSEKKPTRRCANCGDEFVPHHSGDRFCGNRRECDQEERECESEAYAARQEAAAGDDYGRY